MKSYITSFVTWWFMGLMSSAQLYDLPLSVPEIVLNQVLDVDWAEHARHTSFVAHEAVKF